VIERKGMIFTSDAKNFKHLRENERYDCPLCLMAAMWRGVDESEIQMHGKKNECVAARGEREGDKRLLGNFNLIPRES
jgi:hypothetical protein